MKQTVIFTVKRQQWTNDQIYKHVFLGNIPTKTPDDQEVIKEEASNLYPYNPVTIYHIESVSQCVLEYMSINCKVKELLDNIRSLQNEQHQIGIAISQHFSWTGTHIVSEHIVRFDDDDEDRNIKIYKPDTFN